MEAAVLFLKKKKEKVTVVLCASKKKKQPNKNISSYTTEYYIHRQSLVCTEASEHCVQLDILLLYSDLPICHAKSINGSKRHMNNFTKSDYASKYEHLISDGIRTEMGRISKSA